ncbi:hypothetical protein [Virgibacillus sp. Bac332]|uniref:hypothetical protein n=1 Tax=Virgibacillus sp. Bac332 TaxID=2419842 RepID=UPI000EF44DAB|nr:hypothetical protein [Virgibacillus sp. Bac332]
MDKRLESYDFTTGMLIDSVVDDLKDGSIDSKEYVREHFSLEERFETLSEQHDKALAENERYKQITKDLRKLCDDYRNGYVGEITDSFLVDRITETLKGENNG